jgi:hypothetical protein
MLNPAANHSSVAPLNAARTAQRAIPTSQRPRGVKYDLCFQKLGEWIKE